MIEFIAKHILAVHVQIRTCNFAKWFSLSNRFYKDVQCPFKKKEKDWSLFRGNWSPTYNKDAYTHRSSCTSFPNALLNRHRVPFPVL